MDEPQKMLEEKQLAAPAVAEGKYPESGGDWRVWFRRAFAVDRTTVVSAALEVADPAMSPHARFAVVDADGGRPRSSSPTRAPPRTFEPNERSACSWRTAKPWRRFRPGVEAQRPRGPPVRVLRGRLFDAQAPEIFTGRYRPSYAHLVCRFRWL